MSSTFKLLNIFHTFSFFNCSIFPSHSSLHSERRRKNLIDLISCLISFLRDCCRMENFSFFFTTTWTSKNFFILLSFHQQTHKKCPKFDYFFLFVFFKFFALISLQARFLILLPHIQWM